MPSRESKRDGEEGEEGYRVREMARKARKGAVEGGRVPLAAREGDVEGE